MSTHLTTAIVLRPRRLLVAEDDDALREILVDHLRREGHEVAEARDGSHLLACLTELLESAPGLPDLIVTDVHMPGFTGMNALATLRSAGIHTPVLILTAFGDARLHRDAVGLGARVMDKPFRLDELSAAVRGLVAWPPRTAHVDERLGG